MPDPSRTPGPNLSNAEIADQLNSLAQLLTIQKENPFKAKAHRTAAKQLKMLSESIEEFLYRGADLTVYSGIGKTIAAALQEIVSSGSSRQLENLRSQVRPEISAISQYPRLDPAKVLRIYKKLNIGSIDQLKSSLTSGEILPQLGARMEQHGRQA